MKIILALTLLLSGIFTNEIDFVLQTVDQDQEDIYKVIMPTLDGKPMPAALTVEDTVQASDFLPVIFKDTKGRQSELQFISLVDLKDIDQYREKLEKKGLEEDEHEQIGNIDEENIFMSLEQARKNLHKIGTIDAKIEGNYLKMVKREYAKRGQNLSKVPLSRYDQIVSMIPDTSGTDFTVFKSDKVPSGNIIDAWAAEDEEEGQGVLEVVYVLVDCTDDQELKSDKEVAAEQGNNDIDVLVSGFTRKGIELVDKVSIQVVMNDSEFTEIFVDETPELKDYKLATETDKFIRVIFTDKERQMCSQPVPVLLMHKLDKTNTIDSIDESITQLSRENAMELKAFGQFNEDNPEPIMLNRYAKVDELSVIENKELAQKVITDQQIIELGADDSVLMITVSNPFVGLLKKHILLM